MTKTPITTASTNVKRFSRLARALRRAVLGVPSGLGLASCVPFDVITKFLHFWARVLGPEATVVPFVPCLSGVSLSDSGLELSSLEVSGCFSGLPPRC